MQEELNRIYSKQPRKEGGHIVSNNEKFEETELEICKEQESPVQEIQIIIWQPSTDMRIDYLDQADSKLVKDSDDQGNEVARLSFSQGEPIIENVNQLLRKA